MLLLAPTAAIVGALLTVPALVALYLLKMRRRPVRVSVLAHWPAAGRDAQANTPLAMIRPSWLLLLHALILGLLLIAAGRPALRSAAGTSGDRVYLLIDVSASMDARDEAGGPTRLERALERAGAMGENLLRAGGRRVAVVEVGATPRVVEGLTGSRAALRDAITRVAQRDEPADLGAAVALVRAVGAGEDEAAGLPSVVLFSDGAFHADERGAGVPAGVRFERVGPAPGTRAINAGIVAFAARRDVSDPGTLRVFLEVLSTDPAGSGVPLAIALDGRVLDRRTIEVPPAGDSPGRAAVSLGIPGVGGGVLTATISRDDALASDNLAALDIRPPARPAAWIVSPEGGRPTAGRAGSLLLRDTLEELRLRSITDLTPEAYAQRVASEGFEGVDFIIFDRAAPTTTPPRPTLRFGGSPELDGFELIEGRTPGASGVLLWAREHPLLRYVALDALVLADAPALRVDESREDLRVLARGPGGPLLVLVDRAGVRHLLASFDLSRSNWPLLPGFPVFLAGATDFLTLAGERSEGLSVRTGESVELRATGAGRLTLGGPASLAADAPGPGPVRVGPFARAGVYVVRGPTEARAVCVNLLDDLESSLASPEALRVGAREVATGQGVREVREVWWWFVAAALVLLGAEWFVYAWSVRR